MEIKTKKILIIDDDNRNIFALTAVLRAKKYICVSAQSAQQGFDAIAADKDISVVLMDMMMPDMDGYQAMRKMKADPELKKIPVIAVTAQAMVGDKERCLEAGAAGYISKPVNVDELVLLLNKYFLVNLPAISDEQVETLIDDVLDQYGYDFTGYSRASLKRRLNRLYSLDKQVSFAEFRYKIGSDSVYFKRFVEQITVNVTEMFRDPSFYKTLRENVLPTLATYPFIRIWLAGCSTGEEAYSMAIVLKELNLLHKSLIYATDINPTVLEKAAQGMFPLSQMKQYSENYIASGGKIDFSSYYSANYSLAKFDVDLREKMIFSTHNLVSDHSFNEFQLILCRNVLIYFDRDLQFKVLQLFDNSLENLGFLALGTKETTDFSPISKRYKRLEMEKIWRKTVDEKL